MDESCVSDVAEALISEEWRKECLRLTENARSTKDGLLSAVIGISDAAHNITHHEQPPQTALRAVQETLLKLYIRQLVACNQPLSPEACKVLEQGGLNVEQIKRDIAVRGRAFIRECS